MFPLILNHSYALQSYDDYVISQVTCLEGLMNHMIKTTTLPHNNLIFRSINLKESFVLNSILDHIKLADLKSFSNLLFLSINPTTKMLFFSWNLPILKRYFYYKKASFFWDNSIMFFYMDNSIVFFFFFFELMDNSIVERDEEFVFICFI